MICFGFSFDREGRSDPRTHLGDPDTVINFIRENLDAPQLIITDEKDCQLLLMRDGVDLFNALDRVGISLSKVLNQTREDIVAESSQSNEKPKWERLYDQIGLSPGEIRMRQRVKSACWAARTVADVAELIHGTYFNAHFLSSDGQRWHRFFDEKDFSVTLMTKDGNGEWIDQIDRVTLSPILKVQHLRSSEDIHTFELLD